MYKLQLNQIILVVYNSHHNREAHEASEACVPNKDIPLFNSDPIRPA